MKAALVGQAASDDLQLLSGIAAQEHAHVDGKDLVEAGFAETGLSRGNRLKGRPAGRYVVGVAPLSGRDHLWRSVDGDHAAAVELLGDQRHRHSVPASDLQDPIAWLNREGVHRPHDPFRRSCSAHGTEGSQPG